MPNRKDMDMVNSSLGTPKGNTALTDSARDRLIVALDFLSSEQAETLITQLNDRINFYKVGQPLFTSAGPKLLEFLKKENKKMRRREPKKKKGNLKKSLPI